MLFKLYALTSVFTLNQAAFEALYKLNQAEQQEFESICQEMVGHLYHLQESSVCDKSVSNSFHYQLLPFLQTTQELTNQDLIYYYVHSIRATPVSIDLTERFLCTSTMRPRSTQGPIIYWFLDRPDPLFLPPGLALRSLIHAPRDT
jgi:hypothetical protein